MAPTRDRYPPLNAQMNTPHQTAAEAGRILDSLAALSADLACHCDVPPHTMILPASKVREACDAIDEAVASLKRILVIAQESGLGPVSPSALSGLGEEPQQ
jgi:hypothetical protein